MNQLLPLTSNNKGLLYETASCIASIQRNFFRWMNVNSACYGICFANS